MGLPNDSNTTKSCERHVVELGDAVIENTANGVRQMTLIKQQIAEFSALDGSVKGLRDSSADQLQASVGSVLQKIEESTETSQQQNETLCKLLNVIQTQLLVRPPQTPSQDGHLSPFSCGPAEAAETALDESSFMDVIQRLSVLIEQNEGTLHEEEANAIIDELVLLMQNISKEQTLEDRSQPKARKRTSDDNEGDITSREMKRFCGLVMGSLGVNVNKRRKQAPPPTLVLIRSSNGVVPASRSSVTNKGKLVQKYRNKEAKIGNSTTTIILRERTWKDLTADRHMLEEQRQLTEHMMNMQTFVQHHEGSFVLTVQLFQTQVSAGNLIFNPFVSIGKTLPQDSPIFSIVKKGDVEGLQNLISRHEGTLRDRDCFGTPLLHVSGLQNMFYINT